MKIITILLAFGMFWSGNEDGQRFDGHLPLTILPEQSGGTLSRLQENEELTLYFSSFGCFSQSGKKLVFTRTGEGFRLQVFDGRVAYPVNGGQPSMEQGKLLRDKILTPADLIVFASFEKEMIKKRNGFCTTSETYTMVSNYGSVTVNDASCQWFGMNQLISDLFGMV